jgi:hypothetical protein
MDPLQPLHDLFTRHPGLRLVVDERDYHLAQDELGHSDTIPLLDPILARAIVLLWEGLTEALLCDKGGDAEMFWIEVHPDRRCEPFFRIRGQNGGGDCPR